MLCKGRAPPGNRGRKRAEQKLLLAVSIPHQSAHATVCSYARAVATWPAHLEREAKRYQDGLARLPKEADGRQKQLVRAANAANGCGLACLMEGRLPESASWFDLAARRYRESYADAPPESWGRLIGVVKARLLAGDLQAVHADARWALAQSPEASPSPIGHYAAALAALALGRDSEAAVLAGRLRSAGDERFPLDVAIALEGLARADAREYEDGLLRTLRSFETRDEYLEDIPVADTVLVLEALAEPRGLSVRPTSALLP